MLASLMVRSEGARLDDDRAGPGTIVSRPGGQRRGGELDVSSLRVAEELVHAKLAPTHRSPRAVPGDRVARDAARSGVDREQELAVVADLDPARCCLLIGKR